MGLRRVTRGELGLAESWSRQVARRKLTHSWLIDLLCKINCKKSVLFCTYCMCIFCIPIVIFTIPILLYRVRHNSGIHIWRGNSNHSVSVGSLLKNFIHITVKWKYNTYILVKYFNILQITAYILIMQKRIYRHN